MALALALIVALAAPTTGSVVVLHPAEPSAAMSEAIARVAAELGASGFDVSTRSRYPEPGIVAYDAGAVLALFPRPVAAIAIAEQDGTLSAALWRIDADTGRPIGWRVTVPRERADASASPAAVLAVRAVELLHASLAGVQIDAPRVLSPPPPRPSISPPPIQAAPSPWFVGAGAAWLGGFEGDPAFAPRLFVGGAPSRSFRLRLAATGLGWASSVAAAAGTVDVQHALIDADVLWFPWDDRARLAPFVAVGAGAWRMRVQGRAREGFVGHTEVLTSGAAHAGAGIAFRLSHSFSAGIEVQALLAVPGLRVRIDGQEAVSFGRPSLLATAYVAGGAF